jgi:hypothetical protein
VQIVGLRIKGPSPLLYHLGFIVGLVGGGSPPTWYQSQGPRFDVLSKLSRTSVITCSRASDHSLCQLGRHVRLPFPSSFSRVVRPFDLIHCDLWTPPVKSISSYKYYLVILDDCTHSSLTFLLRLKSDTFPTLSFLRLRFHAVWLHHPQCPVR